MIDMSLHHLHKDPAIGEEDCEECKEERELEDLHQSEVDAQIDDWVDKRYHGEHGDHTK